MCSERILFEQCQQGGVEWFSYDPGNYGDGEPEHFGELVYWPDHGDHKCDEECDPDGECWLRFLRNSGDDHGERFEHGTALDVGSYDVQRVQFQSDDFVRELSDRKSDDPWGYI